MSVKTIRGNSDRLTTYLTAEKKLLGIVTISGLIYNLGMVAGPWFEGKMAQCLLDIFEKKSTFEDMLRIALLYALVIAVVQIGRYYKRLYVRRFANDLNLSMKRVIYGNLVYEEKAQLEQENVGAVMTKAISDVETAVEGIRKFTTEIFDTGIAMAGYFVFLLFYDWRLTLLCMIFPPVSYLIAEKMKVVVQRASAALKEASGALNAATLDQVSGALTYRTAGCEEQRGQAYEKMLTDYEKKAVFANIWVSSMQPLYQVISHISVLLIIYFGGKNVLGIGWTGWDIAAFTAFLSCYVKLSVKSSHAAKLFNAVHKAQVSWKRIKPLMKESAVSTSQKGDLAASLKVEEVSFAYPEGAAVFSGLSFTAQPGQIIGITGPVACGKSTLGKVFLNEYPYEGSITFDGKELSSLEREVQKCLVGYLGHDPEIMGATVAQNIAMGQMVDVSAMLKTVCMEEEVAQMPQGMDTPVGSGGIRLSGGQQQRLALARTLAQYRPLLVLDDPFSALDRKTEKKVFENLQILAQDRIILLISHRLYLFPEFDRVIWMEDGHCTVSDHHTLLKENKTYANLYHTQVTEDEEYEK